MKGVRLVIKFGDNPEKKKLIGVQITLQCYYLFPDKISPTCLQGKSDRSAAPFLMCLCTF